MNNKGFKITLHDGRVIDKYFATLQDAIKELGLKNIKKADEVTIKKSSAAVAPSKDSALVISMRSEEDLQLSLTCGYAVTYNCPSYKRIFPGMKYFETSENSVLEAEIVKLAKYDSMVHHHWKGPGFKPDKTWKWAIFHINAQMITRADAEAKYGKISGVQGGIGYLNLSKKSNDL